MTFAGRVEALVNVPTSVTASATNSGGGPTSVSVTSGSRWWTTCGGVTGLAATLQSVLQSARAPTFGSWSVGLSTGATGDARLTIDCTSGAKLTKSGGVGGSDDAGASSNQTITADGFVEFTYADITATRYVGLSTSDPNTLAASINYAVRQDVTDYSVYENGSLKLSISGAAVGDVIRITRTGSTITYSRNGTVYYTSLIASTGALKIDTSILSSGASIRAIRLANVSGTTTTYSTITWTGVTNCTTGTDSYSLAWTSTVLRDICGFTADISSALFPQTGTKQARGVWRPECPLNITDTKLAPLVTDLRTTQSPTGVVLGLVGNSYYRHKSISWPYVPAAQYREALVTYQYASWEWFVKETQLAQGGTTWFSVASACQIYDHNSYVVGGDLNSGTGSATGWYLTGISGTEAQQPIQGYTGLWRIEIAALVGAG